MKWGLDETETNEVLGKGCITEEGWKRIEALKKAILRKVASLLQGDCTDTTHKFRGARSDCLRCLASLWEETKEVAGGD